MNKHRKHKKRAHSTSQITAAWDASGLDHYVGEDLVSDPLTGYEASLRAIQGHQATKSYVCPECNDVIEKGSSHLVVVPIDAPDLRRHWHSYCWVRRQNRLPVPKKRKKGRK